MFQNEIKSTNCYFILIIDIEPWINSGRRRRDQSLNRHSKQAAGQPQFPQAKPLSILPCYTRTFEFVRPDCGGKMVSPTCTIAELLWMLSIIDKSINYSSKYFKKIDYLPLRIKMRLIVSG